MRASGSLPLSTAACKAARLEVISAMRSFKSCSMALRRFLLLGRITIVRSWTWYVAETDQGIAKPKASQPNQRALLYSHESSCSGCSQPRVGGLVWLCPFVRTRVLVMLGWRLGQDGAMVVYSPYVPNCVSCMSNERTTLDKIEREGERQSG